MLRSVHPSWEGPDVCMVMELLKKVASEVLR